MSVESLPVPQKTGNSYRDREVILQRIAAKIEMGVMAKRAIADEGISRATYYLWLKQGRAA